MQAPLPRRGKRGPAPFQLPEEFRTECLAASARELGVSRDCLRKAMKRAGLPFPPKSLQTKFILPLDFVPTTPKEDANRFRVDINTLKAAMRRQGRPPHKKPEKRLPKEEAPKSDERKGWAWVIQELTPEEQLEYWKTWRSDWGQLKS